MIGSLRHRITFEAKTQSPDGGGGFAESWAETFTVFGAVEFLRGGEAVRSGQTQTERVIQIRIRYREGIDPSQRVRLKGALFGIDWVHDPDGRGHWLLLVCTENRPS